MKKLKNKAVWLLTFVVLHSLAFAAGQVIPPAGNYKSRFLIVADSESYQAAVNEISAYKKVLEGEGLGVVILTGDWKDPGVLRAEINEIYHQKPVLEGAVFIGNIPVVRVQNFQHATTAFKMDEVKFPITDASVTSDRFYDDLDLTFEKIRQDEKNPLIFYYRLSENSPQQICSDFYSARMMPPADMGVDPRELLKKYLRKVVAAHKQSNPLDKLVIFNGHGYNSDCLTAWQNEQFAIREQIPAAFKNSEGNGFYNFRQDPFMKFKLFDKLQQTGTDLFVFHEHGDYDTQYINGEYPAMNALEYPGGGMTGPMKAMGVSLRNIYRRYKGERAEKFRQDVMQEYGLTPAFFDPNRLDSLRKSDSVFSADINIVLEDITKIKPQPRMTIFDACYNGSFHQPGYVAGYHVFGDGNTIVAQGNTVNVLQDKWALELLGMLNEGVRAGFWQKEFRFLESHLIGDPTYRFSPAGENHLNTDLALNGSNTKIWKRYLKDENPNLQALAIKKLSQNPPPGFTGRLLDMLKENPNYSVRTEALMRLLDAGGEVMAEAIRLGLDDPYELIRRISARYAGFSGDSRLIAPLVKTVLFAHESQRVQYSAQVSLEMFDLGEVISEIGKVAPGDSELIGLYRKKQISQEKSLRTILDKSAKPEDRISAIRNLRNYNNHKQVSSLLGVLADGEENPDIRINLAEALGWFDGSIRKQEIVEAMKKVSDDPSTTEMLKKETGQSLIRLGN